MLQIGLSLLCGVQAVMFTDAFAGSTSMRVLNISASAYLRCRGGVAGQLVDAYGRASGGPDQSGHVGAFVHESDEPCLRLQWAKVATLVVGRRGWCGEYQWQVMQLPAVAVLGFLIVVDGCRWIEFRREAFDPSGLVAFEPFGNGDVIVKGFLVGHAVRPPLVALVG